MSSERDLRGLVDDALAAGQPTGWFEPLYAGAEGNTAGVPWARLAPHPSLVSFLDQMVAEAGGVREGATAIVVGCGLGDDAEELARRGFTVTAFDVSETAVEWARRRHPDSAVTYEHGDLFKLPAQWRQRFDFVFESRTIQSLPKAVRERAMVEVASLVGPQGEALVLALLATSEAAAADWDGPPWALAPSELAAYSAGGLVRVSLEHPPNDGQAAMEVRLRLARQGHTH